VVATRSILIGKMDSDIGVDYAVELATAVLSFHTTHLISSIEIQYTYLTESQVFKDPLFKTPPTF
jgi:hypothetical protein